MTAVSDLIKKGYQFVMPMLNALTPKLWARITYFRFYGKKCNLREPKSFSEKLLWLWLNDYRDNRQISQLSDKYEVRNFVEGRGLANILNELYFVTDDPQKITLCRLPDRFALKLSQGWNTNLICDDKQKLSETALRRTLDAWSKGQPFYDLSAAKIAGIKRKKLPKHYICEKYLSDAAGHAPSDYKFYCFNGVPKAILFIADRFGEKKGCFMDLNWEILAPCSEKYLPFPETPPRPRSLEAMVDAARILSKGFPFVRVDLYDVDGKPIFGEMTFFPNGCTGTQETAIDGVSMGELISINA